MEFCLMLRFILILFVSSVSCTASPPPESVQQAVALTRFEYTRIIMGVGARLIFYSENAETARAAAEATYERLNELDAILSDYRKDSELMRLCRKPAGEPHPVSPELGFILAQSVEIAAKTGGAFDPTVGPVVRLWRQARKSGKHPDAVELAQARDLVGYEKLAVDSRAQTVTLAKPGMSLDLGGIAKGYAADEALKVLADHGIDRALVDLGGDLAAGSPPPDAIGWRITIETGVQEPRTIDLANGAIATSGDLVQHTIIDGVRFSHIIDPRTGQALTNAVASTVTAPTGIEADALASAACVLGNDAARIEAEFEDVKVKVVMGWPDEP
jgi:FAD:protein FMN transferase